MLKQSELADQERPVMRKPEPSTKVYRDAEGNECTLLELCRKEPEWAANVIATLEAPGTSGAPLGRCCDAGCTTRPAMRARHGTPETFADSCYAAVPAFISVGEANKAIARYRAVYESAAESPNSARQEGSPVCLDCGHPLTEIDRKAPWCPYCGCM